MGRTFAVELASLKRVTGVELLQLLEYNEHVF